MKIKIELTEQDVKDLIYAHIAAKLGDAARLNPSDVRIETKSKQNYKSEWESAAFRATYEGAV